jgi:hypothetical protein
LDHLDASTDDDRAVGQTGADQLPEVVNLARVEDCRRLVGFPRIPTIPHHEHTMPQTSLESASRSNYQAIFDSALEAYKRKTGKDLTKDPLLRSLETCQSPDAVISILRAQLLGPGQSQSSSDELTTWLDPTVNVINAFSATIGGGVSLVSLPKIEAIAF